MTTYSNKVQSVLNAYELVGITLENIPGIKCYYLPSKRRCHIEVWNDITNQWDKEAILNIYWSGDKDEVWFGLVNWPNSNVPFTSIKEKIDYDDDGIIEVTDIIAIATELFGLLND